MRRGAPFIPTKADKKAEVRSAFTSCSLSSPSPSSLPAPLLTVSPELQSAPAARRLSASNAPSVEGTHGPSPGLLS